MTGLPDGFPTAEQFAAQDRSDTARASRQTAQAAEKTRDLTARLLEAQEQLVVAQQQMLDAQTAADVREVKMLFWTRIAGVGAIAALAIALIGIMVTLLAA